MTISPPKATKKLNEIELHGVKRNDPYGWLKADNWQDLMQDPSLLDPEIREYLEAENAFTDDFMKETQVDQEKLVAELRGRIQEDETSVATKDGPYLYFSRFETGGQYPIFLRHKLSNGYTSEQNDLDQNPDQHEVIFNGNIEAEGSSYFALAAVSHSPNHKLLGVAVDKNGSEYYDLEIRDLKRDTIVDTLSQISGDFEWCADNKSIVYSTLDENHRPSAVYLHRFGEDMASDQLLYTENDAGYFVSLDKSESGDFIFINAHQHDTSEVFVVKSSDPRPVNKPVRKRDSGIEYELHHHDDIFILRTNLQGADNFKIIQRLHGTLGASSCITAHCHNPL